MSERSNKGVHGSHRNISMIFASVLRSCLIKRGVKKLKKTGVKITKLPQAVVLLQKLLPEGPAY